MPEHGLLLAGAVNNECFFRSEWKEKQLTEGTVTMTTYIPVPESPAVSHDFEYTDKDYRKYPAFN